MTRHFENLRHLIEGRPHPAAQLAPRLPPELFVCASRRVAELAGFRLTDHPAAAHLRAWWPDLGVAAIRATPWARVTVDSSVRDVTGRDYGRLRDGLAMLQDTTRAGANPACWVGPRSV